MSFGLFILLTIILSLFQLSWAGVDLLYPAPKLTIPIMAALQTVEGSLMYGLLALLALWALEQMALDVITPLEPLTVETIGVIAITVTVLQVGYLIRRK